METMHQVNEINNLRIVFIETLSRQFIAITGCGIYAYLNPVTINELFNQYMAGNVPINAYARQCVRNVVA
ncbi:hypothetical protein A1507_06030 [Methylomonas koyamae]|uniref:Uncharacterized protein n=1 Tax=Methylomonas koyamae TaxID=702114 RepID=A0A177NPV1_9GAMM|nr:hypothetical protein [Methylomonas koyamae]OAI19901.1 hypothetical protein A1507_06030 [Methylomonas koyamae]